MEEREARKEGNSIHLLPPFFLLTLFHLVTHFKCTINCVSELFEEVDLDTFLKEDQATLTRRGKQSMARVVEELRDYLQRECGEGEALPHNVFHDVMLQVHVHTFPLGTWITNLLFNPCLTRICIIQFFLKYFLLFFRESGRFGSAPSCRRWAVSASMRAGLTSTTPWLVPTCLTSGKCAPSCLGRSRRMNWCLASSILLPPRNSCVEVEKEETKAGEASGLINPSGSTTKVYTDQLPIPHDLGVPSDYLPHWESVKKEGAKGGQKSVSIYVCLFCNHRSQNRTSTITHTRRHLNVILGCRLCPFTSESTGPLENHIKEAHGGKFLEEQLTDVESAELVTKL